MSVSRWPLILLPKSQALANPRNPIYRECEERMTFTDKKAHIGCGTGSESWRALDRKPRAIETKYVRSCRWNICCTGAVMAGCSTYAHTHILTHAAFRLHM